MSRTTTGLAAVAAAAIIALTGCAGTGEADNPGPTAGDNAPTDSDLPAEPEPEAEPDPLDFVVAFGETFTWEDGVGIRIDAPVPYTPPENQFVPPPTYPLYLFTITAINGTAAPLEPVLIMPTVTSGDQPMMGWYDQDIVGSPTTAILPAGQLSWPVVSEIADPAYIVLEVYPGFEYEPLIVTNAEVTP